jgi:hypothetical protein
MLLALELLIAFILGGFGRRFAGGLLGQWFGNIGGTQVGRAAWGVLAAVVAFMSGLPLGWAVLVGFGFPIGLILKANAPGMAMGRGIDEFGSRYLDARKRWIDAGWLTWHGLVVAGMPILALFTFGWWTSGAVFRGTSAIALAGLLCAPIHELAWRYPFHIPALGMYGDLIRGPYDPPPTAEFIWGGVLAMALVLAIRFGVPT